MRTSKCCCIPIDTWYDLDKKEITDATQKYLSSCAQHAREGEYTSLLNLKNMGFENVNMARAVLQFKIPFRLRVCPIGLACCGMCSRTCSCRCIQDVLHKLYIKAAPIIYNGVEGDYLMREAYKIIRNPLANHLSIMEVFDSMYTKMGGKPSGKEKNRAKDKRDLMYDYAPIAVGRPNKAGNIMRERNPETGEVLLHNWPDTGLCPYCLPKVTYIKEHTGGRTGRPRKSSSNKV